MNDNPYAPPKAPVLLEQPTPDFQLRVFHPLQVLIATMFGHLLAAGLMISVNEATIGHPLRSTLTVLFTASYTLLALSQSDHLPQGVVLFTVLAAVPLAAVWAWVPLRQLLRGAVGYRANGTAIAVGFSSLVAQIVLYPFL